MRTSQYYRTLCIFRSVTYMIGCEAATCTERAVEEEPVAPPADAQESLGGGTRPSSRRPPRSLSLLLLHCLYPITTIHRRLGPHLLARLLLPGRVVHPPVDSAHPGRPLGRWILPASDDPLSHHRLSPRHALSRRSRRVFPSAAARQALQASHHSRFTRLRRRWHTQAPPNLF